MVWSLVTLSFQIVLLVEVDATRLSSLLHYFSSFLHLSYLYNVVIITRDDCVGVLGSFGCRLPHRIRFGSVSGTRVYG